MSRLADASTAITSAPPKRPGLIRWWLLITLVVIIGGAIASVPLFIDPRVERAVLSGLASRGLEPSPATTAEVSLLSGSVALLEADLVARSRQDGEQRSVLKSPRLQLAIDLGASYAAGGLIIDRLIGDAVEASLRRFRDRSLPLLPEPELPEDSELPADSQFQVPDLLAWWEALGPYVDYFTGSNEEAEASDKPALKPEPVISPEHPRGVRYHPPAARRFLIRDLAIAGKSLELPEAGFAELDLVDFALAGRQLSLGLIGDERSSLTLRGNTRGAGGLNLDLERGARQGSIAVNWQGLPLALLAQPGIAGRELAVWNPSGRIDFTFDAKWLNGVLGGDLVLRITDLRLDPHPAAGPEAQRAAEALNQLRSALLQIDPTMTLDLEWTLRVTGSPGRPRVDGLQAGGLLRALAENRERLLAAAKAKATAALREQAGQAAEQLRNEAGQTLQDIQDGKSPAEAAREAAERLREGGGNLRDRLPTLPGQRSREP